MSPGPPTRRSETTTTKETFGGYTPRPTVFWCAYLFGLPANRAGKRSFSRRRAPKRSRPVSPEDGIISRQTYTIPREQNTNTGVNHEPVSTIRPSLPLLPSLAPITTGIRNENRSFSPAQFARILRNGGHVYLTRSPANSRVRGNATREPSVGVRYDR